MIKAGIQPAFILPYVFLAARAIFTSADLTCAIWITAGWAVVFYVVVHN